MFPLHLSTHRIPVEDMYATIVIYDLIFLIMRAGSLGNAEYFDAVIIGVNSLAFVQPRNCLPRIIFPAAPKVITVAVPEIMVILDAVGPRLLFVACACSLVPVFEGHEVAVRPCGVNSRVAVVQTVDVWVVLNPFEISPNQIIVSTFATVDIQPFGPKSCPDRSLS